MNKADIIAVALGYALCGGSMTCIAWVRERDKTASHARTIIKRHAIWNRLPTSTEDTEVQAR